MRSNEDLASPIAFLAIPPEGHPERDERWTLVEEGFEAAREHEVESLFAVANGFVGTRAALAEGSTVSRPATFVAGIFDRAPDALPELVSSPDWARFRIFVDGVELQLTRGQILEHRRYLDLRQGISCRDWRHCDEEGRITSLSFERLASLADRHALAEFVTIRPENYSATLRVESVLDAKLPTPTRGVDVWRTTTRGGSDHALLIARTRHSGAVVAFAAGGEVVGLDDSLQTRLVREPRRIGHSWEWMAEVGQTVRVEKLVSVFTSREVPNPARAAREHLRQLRRDGTTKLVGDHVREWESRWRTADVKIDGAVEDQRATRFAIYHLISVANPDDEHVSIGARGLSGAAYQGHVFWDTEIYMLPYYTFTHPETARRLLMYRYHTLPGAREKARAYGYRGALFPWEATPSGEEASPRFAFAPDGEIVPILTGELEHHISADIAYAVWQYWHVTGDDQFFRDAGAEIVVETARFWASRATFERDRRYHIRRVIGPDEYHDQVDDNAYTNVMARWNLRRAIDTVAILRHRWPQIAADLTARLGITDAEIDTWRQTAARMYTGFDPTTGLFEQFKGYFDLEPINLADFEPRTAPMDVLLGRERTARSQVIKQPDVLMLVFLLWDELPPRVREANFRYYEPRCGHGSSLSPAVHALLAARLGNLPLAERYFRMAAEIDLGNNMGNAALGVHMAAQGGLWQAVVLGFGGLRPLAPVFTIDPHVPLAWRSLRFPVHWRGRLIEVVAKPAPSAVEVVVERGAPLEVALGADHGRRMIGRSNGRIRASVMGSWEPRLEEAA